MNKSLAQFCVVDILTELSDRKGLMECWDELDKPTQREIANVLVEIVMAYSEE